MSDQTKGGIAWTDKTWNPVRGCSRVSKGCENCYAEDVAVTLDWIVVGGESGPGARPFELTWARKVLTQCCSAGVPVFIKQLGADAQDPENGIAGAATVVPDVAKRLISQRLKDRKGGDPSEWPAKLRVRQWPGGVR